jgi:adenylate cyclase
VTRAEHSVIRLGPLSADETRALVAGLFGASIGEFGAQLQEVVAARAGGNPFFVEEVVRSLIARGVLVRGTDGWMCTAPCEAVDVPATLHGLLLSRVDRLAREPRRLLQEAAVIGAEFDLDLLDAVASGPGISGTALDRLVGADLIQRARDGRHGRRYRFAHGLVHEAVYHNLLLARRTELHERIARAIERAVGTKPERLSDLEALGHHWSRSADKARGARYLLEAGDWARAVYANDDAIRHYDCALRTLAECHGCSAESCAARERLADLLGITGRRADALAQYQAVSVALADAGGRAATARLHRKIGGLHWDAGDREQAAAAFAAGLEALGDDGDPIERAHLFEEMGRLAFRAGDSEAAIAWAERALAHVAGQAAVDPGRQREAIAMRADAYNTLGVALARTGRVAAAIEQIERSIALAEAGELLHAACRGYTNLGVLYSSFDPRRSIETCLRGLETAKKVGDLGSQSRLYANLAVAYCALTDRCEAEGMAAARTAVSLDRRLGLLDHLAVPLIVLGQIHQCRGDRAQALAMYEEALPLAERAGDPQLLFPCYDGLATLHLDAGTHAMAERYLAKAQEICERARLDPDSLMVLPFLC